MVLTVKEARAASIKYLENLTGTTVSRKHPLAIQRDLLIRNGKQVGVIK